MESRDAGPVARLSGELGYPVEEGSMRERLERLSGRPAEGLFVAEDPPGEVVGWIHISEDATLTDGPTAEIRALIVDARVRGRKIGRELLSRAERWAASRGYRHVRVRSRTWREDAHRFYETNGYGLEKTQHVLGKPLTG
ncbi:MAG TPA: GNAT family N-acetyltransferase [Thermoanaerobaculia bacterium]|jgi:GNAT superfamily N-acetyltransferase